MSNKQQINEIAQSWGGAWSHLAALLGRGGHVALGHIAPIEGAAVASDATRVYATLLRREGENLDGLLARLDVAVGEAVRTGAPVNELPGAEFVMGGGRSRRRRER